MTLGARLKAAREAKNYTLKQTSEISGLSTGFISQVERGQADPSLSSLKKLAGALGLKLGDLFEHSSAEHVFVKKGNGRILNIDSHVNCELLASSFNKIMDPMIKLVLPGGESGLVDPHEGEEFIYVLEGNLQVTLGETTYLMGEGDSLYFHGDQPHAWKNTGDAECRAIWVMTPPFYS